MIVVIEQQRPVECRGVVGLVRRVDVVEQVGDEIRRPRLHRVGHHAAVQFGLQVGAVCWAHGQTVVDGARDADRIPWVDENGITQYQGRTRELGQDERQVVVVLAEHELHGRSIHTITDGGDEGQIGHPKQCQILVLVDPHLVVQHRSEVQGPVFTVDVVDQLGDLGLDLGAMEEPGAGHLDEHHLVTPFGVHLEEHLVGLELLHHASHRVQPVSAHDDFFVAVDLAQRGHLVVDSQGRVEGVVLDFGGVDPNGQGFDRNRRPVRQHLARRHLVPKHPRTAAQEVALERLRLEPDLICAQHPVEQLAPLGETPEVF